MTFGVHGTIREAILPTNAWSTEHVASMIGTAGLFAGVTGSLIKPKDVLSSSVKYEVKGNHGLKHDSGGDGGGTPKKNEGMGKVPSNFADRAKLEGHFDKHGGEFGGIYKNADEYLDGAKDVVNNGIKVQYEYKGETRTGYVRFMGNNKDGNAKFEFVGTNNNGEITTYHTQSGKKFWKTINGENVPIINPVE